MEDREGLRGIFSTANGKYAYRETRCWVRPIFREDFCFRDDVEDMAQRLRQDFPEECKLMTAADAYRVEYYFDAVDIQMQTHVFLYEVLMRIVVYNFEEARERVQEYVDRVLLDPVRYIRLTLDDAEIHVFSEEERGLVGYDNTLPAALNILKQHKFLPAFNGPQRLVGTDNDLDSANSVETNISDPAQSHYRQAPHAFPPAATPIAYPPRVYGRKESSQAEHGRRPYEHLSPKAARSNHFQPTTYPTPLEQTTYFEPMRPDGQMTPKATQSSPSMLSPPLLLEQASSIPVAQSHHKPVAADRRAYANELRVGLNDRFVGITKSMPQIPPFRRQGSKGSRHFKGSQTTTKKTSNDIRRQSMITNVHTFFPQPFQAQSMPVTTLPSQPPLMQRHGTFPLMPDRMNPVGFSTSFDTRPHQRSPVDSVITDSPTALVPYYPRPEFCRARSETGDIHCQYVNNSGNSLQPRVLSNPFPPTILEDREGEGNSVDQITGLFPLGYQSVRTSQHSAINLQTELMSSHSPLRSVHHKEPHEFIQYGPQSAALIKKENYIFPSHHSRHQTVRQSQTQNKGGRRKSDQDQLRNHHHSHRQSFPQEQRFTQCLPQPHADCILFISGLPEYLDVKAIWHMLSPVQGLKWVAPLKKAQSEGGHIFTYLVFHEPSFAAEALDLLPRTSFTAMNGRFLSVCRFDPDLAGPIKYWNSSISSRSEHYVYPIRRSSEPAFPAQGRLGFLNHGPGHQSRLLASESCEDAQSGDSIPQSSRATNDHNAESRHLLTHKAEKASDEVLQDHFAKEMQVSIPSEMTQAHKTPSCELPNDDLKIMDGPSAASTGSPVKRVKRKGANNPKSGKNKSKDLTKTPPKQPATSESGTLRDELQELTAEEMEIAARQSGPSTIPSECSVIESVPEAKQTSSNEPEQETQPQEAGLTSQFGDIIAHHSTEKVGPSTNRPPVQTSQTKLPLQGIFKDRKKSVHLPLSPKVPRNIATHSEATSLKQTGLTPLAKATENLQRDLITNEDVIRQDSAATKSRKFSSITNEQRLAAEASQRQFAAGLVHTQSKSNNSKQKGKAQRLSISSKNTYQQPSITTHAEKAGGTKHRSTETPLARRRQHPASQKLLHRLLPTPKIGAPRLSPIDIERVSSAHNDPSLMDVDDDVSSKPMRGSTFVEGASSSMRCRLPIVSPTTNHHQVDSSSTGGHDTPITIGVDLKMEKYYETPSDKILDTAYLQNKLASTNVQFEGILQPMRTTTNQLSPLFQMDVLDLPHASPLLKGEQKLKENTCIKKAPSMRQERNTGLGSCPIIPTHNMESRAARTGDEGLGLGFGETHREYKEMFTTPIKELTEEQVRPDNTIFSNQISVTPSGKSCTSLNRQVQSPVPTRSSSIVQNPTSSPILTRKKKQKKFPRTKQEPEELNVPHEIGTDEGKKRVMGSLASSAGGESNIEKELQFITEASSSIPPQSPEDFVQITDTIRPSPKTEIEDFETSESTFTHSTLFVTPPNTPPPGNLSLLEYPPITPVAITNNHTDMLKNVSNSKSKNRKKNRPGKKKPKSASKFLLDPNVPVSGLVVANSGAVSSTLSLHNTAINSDSKKSLLEREAFQDAEYSTTEDGKSENVYGDEGETAPPSPEFSIKNYAMEPFKGDADISQKLPLFQAYPNSEDHERNHPPQGSPTSRWGNSSLLQVAREAGYRKATDVLPIDFSEKPRLALGERCSKDLAFAREPRPRCSKATLKRIQDSCDHEKQTREPLHLKISLHNTEHSIPKSNMVHSVMDVQKEYQDSPYKDRKGDLYFGKKLVYGELSGIERVEALDYELHSIIREAVQMIFPFVSDKNDLEHGILYTVESMRAKRILKVTDFREISPLVSSCDRDTKWVSEWCDEVAQWLHLTVPRMTELQRKAIYSWEKANPSMQQNLMALGFTALEIKHCGLIWTPKPLEIHEISPQREQEPRGSRPRRRSASDISDVSSSPCQPSINSERNPKTQICLAAAASCSKSDPFYGQFEEIEGVESGPQWAIDTKNDNEDTIHKKIDEAESWKARSRSKKEVSKTESKLLKSVHSDDEKPQEVDVERRAKPEEVAKLLRERKKGPVFEEEKANLQREFPGLSFASIDGVIDIGPTGSVKWKTVSDRLSIAAAIKQNEEDLHGKSLARKYKKVDQVELKTLGLTPSLLTTTTTLPSTLPKSNDEPDSSSLDVAAPISTPEPLERPILLSPMRPVPTDTIDTSTVRTAPSVPQVPYASKPSYATALQSPIRRPQSTTQGFTTPKPTYAIALQASDSRCNGPRETDAWALRGEEAWGTTTSTTGEGSPSPEKTGEGGGDGALTGSYQGRGRGS